MRRRSGAWLFLAMALGMMVAGCGAGVVSSAPTVSGVAAAGAPLSGTVYLKDSSNPAHELSAPAAADGSFSFNVSGLTPPFLLKAAGNANGSDYAYYSFAAAAGVANVNPLSHLAVAEANSSDDLASLYAAPDPARMQSIRSALDNVVGSLRTVFRPTLVRFGADGVNFITDGYAANHKGLDLMLDLIAISVSNGEVTVTDRTTDTTKQTPLSAFLTDTVDMIPTAQTMIAGSLLVLPLAPSVVVNGTMDFSAIVVGTADQRVNWHVVEPDGGSITSAGGYTPANIGTYHIEATSVSDPTKSVTIAVVVTRLLCPRADEEFGKLQAED